MDEFSKPQRQSPVAIAFILLKYGRRIFRLIAPLLIIFFVQRSGQRSADYFLLYFAGAIAVYQLILSLLEYFRFYYHIQGDDLVIQRGVWRKKRISIPFDRIQGVNFEQNILHRYLKAVEFHVDTAGSVNSEVSLDALSVGKAEKLRDFILKNKKAEVLEEETSQDQVQEKERVIFSVDIPTLLRIGLTANHVQTMGIILGFLWGIYTYAEEIFRFDPNDIVNVYEQFVGYSLIIFSTWLIASVLLSLVRTVFQYYNLKFWEYEAGFKWVAGLLTRQEQSAPYEKVQYIRWRTNPLRRIIGLFSLRLFVAGSARSRSFSDLPGSTLEHVSAIQKLLYPKEWLHFEEKNQISKKVIGRRLLYFGIVPALMAGALLYFQYQWWALLVLLWIPLSYLLARRYQARWAYWINDDMIKTFSGVIASKEVLLPIYKVQAVTFSQTPYQLRKGLVNLNLSTAAGQLRIPYLEKDRAEKLRDDILYRVEREQKAWM
ncbi:MAG: PH domain-containing protein [Bacteroidia bacterium]|nr:PH domain-containing protein [Bacteroidia bacterium]